MHSYQTKMKFLTVIMLCAAITSAHEISQLKVPLYADPRRAAELSCHFNMGDQKLHSVKWYRDVNEIFRYNPQHEPSIRLFNISEVMVQSGKCYPDSCVIWVMPSPKFTKAAYTCEVSTEGPMFLIARDTKYMTVVVMPELNPVISGAEYALSPGDHIYLNCTSDFSLPPSAINWFIDGVVQKPEAKPETIDNQPGLRRSWRGLRLLIPSTASRTVHIRCVSTIYLDQPVVRETDTIITIHSHTQLSKYVAYNDGTKASYTLGDLVIIILIASEISRCKYL